MAAVFFALPLAASSQSRSLSLAEVNPDARMSAMGGNWYGEASTMQIYANPSSILYSEAGTDISASTLIYPSAGDGIGRNMYYAASASKRFGINGLHIGFRYQGGLELPVEGGTLSPEDYTVDAAYSIRLSDRFSLAAGIGFVHSKILTSASAVSFNIGGYFRDSFNIFGNKSTYILGVSVRDFGTSLDYGTGYSSSSLPGNIGMGGETSVLFGDKHRVTLALSERYYLLPSDATLFTGNIGAEYTFNSLVSLRAGYRYAEHDFCSYSVGAGISLRFIRLDVCHQRGIGGNKINLTSLSLGVGF